MYNEAYTKVKTAGGPCNDEKKSTYRIGCINGFISENEWASDEVKENAIKKLDKIVIHAAYPDAFDSTGAQFDENGRLKNWWTEEDSKEFKRRVGKMDDYLDGIVAFGDEHFIGTNVDTEMDADMTGLQCALRMASKVDDFDYDKFFKKYAQLNAILMLYSSELSNLKQDEHPLYYSRTNVPVQQFEEFYETYGVKEGDNMYLAPEDRLILW